MEVELTQQDAAEVLRVIDRGLCHGHGQPIPGEMSVGGAVCYALGFDYDQQPPCVSGVVFELAMCLNDAPWSTNAARAKGLRRLAVAMLGTSNEFDEQAFAVKFSEAVIADLLPKRLAIALPEAGSHEAADKAPEAVSTDELLGAFAERIVRILVRMKTPGADFIVK